MQNPIYLEKTFFKEYGNGKEIWKAGVIEKRIGD